MQKLIRIAMVGMLSGVLCLLPVQSAWASSPPNVSLNYVNVSGSTVTIDFNIFGNYSYLETDCGLGFAVYLDWPNELIYPVNWYTSSGIGYSNISGTLWQTQYGGSGYAGCSGGGHPQENIYHLQFTFTETQSGSHTFYYRVMSDVSYAHTLCGGCDAIQDYWVEIPYNVP
jgi:hypothetical protein